MKDIAKGGLTPATHSPPPFSKTTKAISGDTNFTCLRFVEGKGNGVESSSQFTTNKTLSVRVEIPWGGGDLRFIIIIIIIFFVMCV